MKEKTTIWDRRVVSQIYTKDRAAFFGEQTQLSKQGSKKTRQKNKLTFRRCYASTPTKIGEKEPLIVNIGKLITEPRVG